MCGRFTLRVSTEQLIHLFKLMRVLKLEPRYNIGPAQSVAVIRQTETERELTYLHWGLVPAWSKDPNKGPRPINARAETLADKPSFRGAFKYRRCLIPADGFYEWQQSDRKTKQPYFIGLKSEEPFAFAGLWEHWEGADGSEIESCSIITTQANALLKPLHQRMPVILPQEAYDRWLDPKQQNTDDLLPLLMPYAADTMDYYPVSTIVNNARNEVPDCVKPISTQATLFPEE